jgi:hypothetical protein
MAQVWFAFRENKRFRVEVRNGKNIYGDPTVVAELFINDTWDRSRVSVEPRVAEEAIKTWERMFGVTFKQDDANELIKQAIDYQVDKYQFPEDERKYIRSFAIALAADVKRILRGPASTR